MLSNLPPGCTNAMIEAQVGSDDVQYSQWQIDSVKSVARCWYGEPIEELIADILECTDDDHKEVLAKARGELELRQQKRRKAGK